MKVFKNWKEACIDHWDKECIVSNGDYCQFFQKSSIPQEMTSKQKMNEASAKISNDRSAEAILKDDIKVATEFFVKKEQNLTFFEMNKETYKYDSKQNESKEKFYDKIPNFGSEKLMKTEKNNTLLENPEMKVIDKKESIDLKISRFAYESRNGTLYLNKIRNEEEVSQI